MESHLTALLSTHSFLIELEFVDIDFYGERVGGGRGIGGTGEPGETPSEQERE